MDVYISYAERDSSIASYIYNVLCDNEFICILSRSNSQIDIKRNIKGCDEFLLICSNAINSSELVMQEIEIALDTKKYICIFTVEKTILSDRIDRRLELFHQILAYPDYRPYIGSLVRFLDEYWNRKDVFGERRINVNEENDYGIQP